MQRNARAGRLGLVVVCLRRNRYRDTCRGERFYGDTDQRHTFNVYAFFRHSDRVSFGAKPRIGSNFPTPGYFASRDGDIFAHRRAEQLAAAGLRAGSTCAPTGPSTGRAAALTLFAEIINVLNRDNVRFSPPGIKSRRARSRSRSNSMMPIVPSLGVLIEF